MTKDPLQLMSSDTRVSIYEVEANGDTGAWRASGFLMDPGFVLVHPDHTQEIGSLKRFRVAIQYRNWAVNPVEVIDVRRKMSRRPARETSAPGSVAATELIALELSREAAGPPERWIGSDLATADQAEKLRELASEFTQLHGPGRKPAAMAPVADTPPGRGSRKRPKGCNWGCVLTKGKCHCTD